MSDDRSDPVIRKGALLLSSLVLTPDAGIEAFRERRMARKDVDPELVKKARTVLDAVGFLLRSDRREDWRKLEQAWDALRKIERPPEEEEPEEPAAIPGMDPAQPSTASAEAPPGDERGGPAPAKSAALEVGAPPGPSPSPASPDAASPPPSPGSPAEMPTPPSPPGASPPASPPAAPASPPAAPPALGVPPAAAPAEAPSPAPQAASSPAASRAAASPPAGPPAPPAVGVPPAAAEPPGAPGSGSQDVDATSMLDADVLGDLGDALPFEQGAAAPPPAPVADELPAPSDSVDATVAGGIHLGEALPFEGGSAPEGTERPLPDLTLEQYASLCAERDMAAEGEVEGVLRRYGLPDEAAARALDGHWSQRLQAAPERSRFEQLRASYRDWLNRQRGS